VVGEIESERARERESERARERESERERERERERVRERENIICINVKLNKFTLSSLHLNMKKSDEN